VRVASPQTLAFVGKTPLPDGSFAKETTMPEPGLLSLTYHLVHFQSYRSRWLDTKYDAIFEEFGIDDPATQAAILEVNQMLGTNDTSEVEALVSQWMEMVGNDILARSANPKILW
jgi:hypothetical protein